MDLNFKLKSHFAVTKTSTSRVYNIFGLSRASLTNYSIKESLNFASHCIKQGNCRIWPAFETEAEDFPYYLVALEQELDRIKQQKVPCTCVN